MRRLAKARGFTVSRLADFAGISRARMSYMMAGEGSPTLRTASQLAEALGVPLEDLIRRREPQS